MEMTVYCVINYIKYILFFLNKLFLPMYEKSLI